MKIAVFIPAYEAESTLESVVRRIPSEVYESTAEILIQDDASTDNTFKVAMKLASEFSKITCVRNEANLRYGGTKKKAYQYCIAKKHDVVVMVHGDGQYPPENLSDMLAPLRAGTAEIVLGSRILGAPITGGMPLYKWVGNRFLTFITNQVLHLHLTDYHTGYRAYSCKALSDIEIETCGNGHEISSEILIRATDRGLRITEVSVPTSYGRGSRSCSFMTSVRYGLNVIRILLSNVGSRYVRDRSF